MLSDSNLSLWEPVHGLWSQLQFYSVLMMKGGAGGMSFSLHRNFPQVLIQTERRLPLPDAYISVGLAVFLIF